MANYVPKALYLASQKRVEELREGLREAVGLFLLTQSDCPSCSAWMMHEDHEDGCRFIAICKLAGIDDA